MKKSLIILMSIIGVSQAFSQSHIHHLYGLKEPTPGLFTLDALSQENGNNVEVETFTMNFQLGFNYDYSKTSNSVRYLDSTLQTLTLLNSYELPNLYETAYQGIGNIATLQQQINTISYNPITDTAFYSYSTFSKRVTVHGETSGILIAESDSLSFNYDNNTLSTTIYQDEFFLSGSPVDSNYTRIYTYNAFNIFNLDTIDYLQEFIYLTSDIQEGVFGIAPDGNFGFDLLQFDDSLRIFNIIGSLPSCTDCNNETFSYDKNAMVIDPENDHLIVARSETVSGLIQYYLTTFSLADASVVYNVATSERYSNLIFNKPLSDLVYPGDANQDKFVTMHDILPIGIKYNDLVDERLEISTEWIGQNAINSGDSVFGVDKKHADCNGDAQINVLDIDNAVLNNYSYVHYSDKGITANCDFPLYVNYPSILEENDSVEIEIGLDLSFDVSQEVYGVVFTLEYDTNFVVSNTMSSQGVNAWFGTEDLNYVQRNVDNYPLSRMDVGVVGIDKLNRDGGGVLVKGIWTMEDEVIPIAQDFVDMNITISDVYIIDYNQNVIDACGLDTFVRIYDKIIGVKEQENLALDLYPNPTTKPYLNLSNINNIERVEIYDLHGKLLQNNISDFSNINISHFSKGVYVVKAYAGQKVYVNKLIFSKS